MTSSTSAQQQSTQHKNSHYRMSVPLFSSWLFPCRRRAAAGCAVSAARCSLVHARRRRLGMYLLLGLASNGILLAGSGVLMLLKHRRSRLAATISLSLLLAFFGVLLLSLFYGWLRTPMNVVHSAAQWVGMGYERRIRYFFDITLFAAGAHPLCGILRMHLPCMRTLFRKRKRRRKSEE